MKDSVKLLRISVSPAVRNVNIVLLTSLVYTGLGFLITTVLARRMSLEEFGLYRLLIDTTTTAYPLLLFGLQYTWMQAIASTRLAGEQAQQKAAILVLTAVLIGMVVLGGQLLIEPLAAVWNIGKYSTLIPFLFVISVPLFRDTIEGVLVAQGKFVALAISVVAPQVLILGVIVYLPAPNVASVSAITALVVTLFVFFSMLYTGISFRSLGSTLHSLLKANWHVGLPIYLAGGIVLLGRNLIQLFTGARLDNIEYGNLSLALMMAGLCALIPAAIAKAKFRDFVTAPRITKWIFVWASFFMLVGGGVLMAAAYAYVHFVLKEDFMASIQFLPLLIGAGVFHGLGDIINRFFLAKGNTSVLARISLATGGFSTIGGVVLIQLFGVWGVVAERVSASILFLGLYAVQYKRFSNPGH